MPSVLPCLASIVGILIENGMEWNSNSKTSCFKSYHLHVKVTRFQKYQSIHATICDWIKQQSSPYPGLIHPVFLYGRKSHATQKWWCRHCTSGMLIVWRALGMWLHNEAKLFLISSHLNFIPSTISRNFISFRDHPFKTSANFRDFWPLPPYHRHFSKMLMKGIFYPYVLWPFAPRPMGKPPPPPPP